MNTLIDWIKRYWFGVSALALAILYVMFDRRGRTIQKLVADARANQLGLELMKVREKAKGTGDDYVKAMEKYRELKRLHPELFAKYSRRGPSNQS